MRRLTVYVCGVVLAAACNRGSTPSGSPTAPNPLSIPANLSGRVTETVNEAILPIAGATLTISEGMNAGKTTTTSATGDYSFTALRREQFSISISANGYATNGVTVDLTTELSGDLTRNFTLSPSVPRTPFGGGLFKIGIDIPHGRYFSDPAQAGCYWERLRGLSGTFADLIANRFVGYNAMQLVVDILPTDVAFKTDAKCGTWFDSPRHGAQSGIPPGVWLVGSQITPGTYEVSSGTGCYWERLRHFQYQGATSVIANGFSTGSKSQTVTIAASDAGFSNDAACGTWTRTASLQPLSAPDSIQQSLADIERNLAQRVQARQPDTSRR